MITSLHFASLRAADIRTVQWDLSAIDEAHKLRNAYRPSNRMGQNIRWALENRHRAFFDRNPAAEFAGRAVRHLHHLGRSHLRRSAVLPDPLVNTGGDVDDLRNRLKTFSIRTLRRQVVEYIPYTERRLITCPFKPTDQEHKLYEAVSAFLQRPETYALPLRQRHLTALVVRKLLASSPLAVAATLEAIRDRLVAIRDAAVSATDLVDRLIADEEIEEEILDEILDSEPKAETEDGQQIPIDPNLTSTPAIDPQQLEAEIEELTRYAQWARSIGIDTKSRALVTALRIGFGKMTEIGAAQRGVVFTESPRTQAYLKDFLEANGYAGRVITFNGTTASRRQRPSMSAGWI